MKKRVAKVTRSVIAVVLIIALLAPPAPLFARDNTTLPDYETPQANAESRTSSKEEESQGNLPGFTENELDELIQTDSKDISEDSPVAGLEDSKIAGGNGWGIVKTEDSEKTIVGEIVEKREPNVKHFLNDDSTYTASVYGYDVHFENNAGEFIDIDNTLVYKAADSKNRERGAYLENTNNSFNAQFAQNADSPSMVTLKNNGYEISWNLQKAAAKTIQDTTTSKLDMDEEETGVALDAKLVEKVSSTVEYKDVLDQVDLQYNLLGTMVKETIVLKNADAESEFSFLFNTGELVIQEKDGETIFETPKGEAIYRMEPMVMWDAAMQTSSEISTKFSPVKGADGTNQYELKVIPSEKWLSDPERQYPVMIDPTISTVQNSANVVDGYIRSDAPNGNYMNANDLKIGTNGSAKYYGFLWFQLPTQIKGSERVVHAELGLAPYTSSSFTTAAGKGNPVIEAHRVTENWPASPRTWNSPPIFSTEIIDYETVDSKVVGGTTYTAGNRWYGWDITRLVDDWYMYGENHGILLKYQDSYNQSNATVSFKAAAGTAINQNNPVIHITYLNTTGLEDYWTYTSQAAGLAGVGYINDFTGELTAVFEDCFIPSERSPLSISHIYNSSRKDEVQSTLDVGKGWRLNIQESIVPVTINSQQKYKYTDGDGTEHYFEKNSSNEWVDDSGLDYKLTIGTSTYTIRDKKDNTRTFNKNLGYLTEMQDSNGNKTIIHFNASNKIYAVTDSDNVGTRRQVTFTLSGSRLSSMTLPDNRTISYTYDAGGFLTQVTHPGQSVVNGGGTTSVTNRASYTYDSQHTILIGMTDLTKNRGVYFQHLWDSNIRYRVDTFYVKKTGALGPETQHEITYKNHMTTYREDLPGLGRWEQYTFNTMGQTVNALDQDGHAIFYKMGAAGGAKNKITFTSKVQGTVNNLLQNSNFEANGPGTTIDYFYPYEPSAADHVQVVTSPVLIGQKALQVQKNAQNSTPTYASQEVVVPGGKEYTFSAYIKTANFNASIANAGATFILEAPDYPSQSVVRYGLLSNSDYTRHALTMDLTSISPETMVTVNVKIGANFGAGQVYADCVQFEEGSTANRYNLLDNGDMELEYAWQGTGVSNATGDGWTTDEQKSGESSYHITGNPKTSKMIHQTQPVYGSEGEGLVAGVWLKTNGVPNKDTDEDGTKQSVGITLQLKNKDDPLQSQYESIFITPTEYEWQYICMETVANFDYSEVTLYLRFSYNCNDVYFDDVQLYKDSFGESFTYDAKGNVVSVVDMAKNTERVIVDGNNDLSTYKDGAGHEYGFEYDNGNSTAKQHNVTQVTAPDGSYTRMAYGSGGQQTYATVYASGYEANNAERRVTTGTTYDTAGNYKATETDARDLVTIYSYNATNGLLNQIKEPVGAMSSTNSYRTTNYAYDAGTHLLTGVSGRQYRYDKKNLTGIQVGSFTSFALEYDDKDNLTSLEEKNGNSTRSIMENTYDASRNLLTSTQYGNGQTIEYEYDLQDRVIASTSADVENRYTYNSNGQLGKTQTEDSASSSTYTTWYDYDFADRLIQQTDSKGFMVSNVGFNKNNQDTGYSASIRNSKTAIEVSSGLEYNNVDEETKNTVKVNGQNAISSYRYYDTLGRLSSGYVEVGATNDIWSGISYLDIAGDAKRTTNMTQQLRYRYTSTPESGQAADLTYSYAYDRAGNVTSASSNRNNGQSGSYNYNEKGELISESYGSFLAYDEVGNRISKSSEQIYWSQAVNHNYDSVDQEESISRRSPSWNAEYYYGSGAKKYQLNEYIERDAYSPRDIGWEYAFDYDGYGNLIYLDRYMNLDGYGDTLELSWKNATQIESITQTTSSNQTVERTYSYNGSNISKIEKSNGSYTELYYYDNLLEYELYYNSSGNLTRLLKYCYDSNGKVEFLLSKTDQFFNPNAYNLYYYLHDGLDNVTGLLRVKAQSGTSTVADNTLAAEYYYDAFGECTITNSYDTIASVNSIRFKDYYYDSDLEWYWLSSRYYAPDLGRFISPDNPSVMMEDLDTVYDKNPYVYCDNNPISRADNEGELWFGAAIGAVVGAASSIIAAKINGEKINWKDVGKSALVGAVTGLIGGPVVGRVVAKAVSKVSVSAAKSVTKLFTAQVRGVGKYGANKYPGIRIAYKRTYGRGYTHVVRTFQKYHDKWIPKSPNHRNRYHWQTNSYDPTRGRIASTGRNYRSWRGQRLYK